MRFGVLNLTAYWAHLVVGKVRHECWLAHRPLACQPVKSLVICSLLTIFILKTL